MWIKIRSGSERMEPESIKLLGIAGRNADCLGLVNLNITIRVNKMEKKFPFCIVDQECFPCCLILGFNILEYFEAV